MFTRLIKILLILTALLLLCVIFVAWLFGLQPFCGPKSIADTQIGLHLPATDTIEKKLTKLGWVVKPERQDLWHFNYPNYALQTWATKKYILPMYKPEVLIQVHKYLAAESLVDTLSKEEREYYEQTNVEGGVAIVINNTPARPIPVFLHNWVYRDVIKELVEIGFSNIQVNTERYTQVCD